MRRVLLLAAGLLLVLPLHGGERSSMDLRSVAILSFHLYEGPLRAPRGLFFDPRRGEIWVADTGSDVLSAFTPDAVELFAMRVAPVREPVRVAVDSRGRLLVLGDTRPKIAVFNQRGEYLSDLALPGVGPAPVFGTITIDADGNLYVGENESGQVLVYDKDLKLKLKFGERGTGQGDFQAISGIAVDAENIVVVDQQITPTVQLFDRRGNLVRSWGKHDMGLENFSLPEGVAFDAKGRIVVVDALRHEIKLFDREGKFIDRFGGMGRRVGQVMFPSGVAVDTKGLIYVAERGNDRVQVFQEIGEPSAEPEGAR